MQASLSERKAACVIEPKRCERRRETPVTLAALGVFLGGATLGCFQGSFIFRGLSYCLNTDEVYEDTGTRFAAAFGVLGRTLVYGLVLFVVFLPFVIAARRASRAHWLGLGVALVIAAGGLLFVSDYAANNQIESVAKSNSATEEVAERCPGNRPPWWPI